MKRRFSKILGVGLTLALLASFLVMGAPVSALTQPSVTLVSYEISTPTTYTIMFQVTEAVPASGHIVLVFDEGTIVPTSWADGAIRVKSTPGFGEEQSQDVGTGTITDDLTVTIDLTDLINDGIGEFAMVKVELDGIGNPDTTGDYTIDVSTLDGADATIEAAVTSSAYTLIVPEIEGLPGVAYVYNPTGVLMAQKNDLQKAIIAAGPDYTIYVGPGTYDDAATIDITHEGLTFVSTDGAATTIISGRDVWAIEVSAADVTVDGFTVEAGGHGILIDAAAENATVKNNIITAAVTNTTGIYVNGVGPTVSGNKLDEYCTIIVHNVSGGTISDNTLGECINLWPSTLIDGLTITDNTMIGSAAQAIDFYAGCTFNDILIEGNTISGAKRDVAIQIRDAATITALRILNNDITDNTGDGIRIDTGAWATSNVIKFNTITGNDTSIGDYGIQNDTATPVDATLNWWGTTVAADIAAMVKGTPTTGTVTTAPFLAGTADTVFSATKAGTGATLDASTTVGVKVEGADDESTIVVAEYTDNPQADIVGAIAFYDVYVTGSSAETVTVKFYAGDANTDVYIWAAGTQLWAKVLDEDVRFSAYGGFISVTVDPANLAGTPFALVAGAAAVLTTPTITIPVIGAEDVSLRPTLVWGGVDAADAYDVWLADNPDFTDASSERVTTTFWATAEDLQYDTTYWWRVRAVTLVPLDLGEWSQSVFITMAEPVEPVDIILEPVEPADIILEPADIIIEPPDVIVTVPPATPIAPGWIYVIIAVGGVLVIALVVLIVRTRRVA